MPRPDEDEHEARSGEHERGEAGQGDDRADGDDHDAHDDVAAGLAHRCAPRRRWRTRPRRRRRSAGCAVVSGGPTSPRPRIVEDRLSRVLGGPALVKRCPVRVDRPRGRTLPAVLVDELARAGGAGPGRGCPRAGRAGWSRPSARRRGCRAAAAAGPRRRGATSSSPRRSRAPGRPAAGSGRRGRPTPPRPGPGRGSGCRQASTTTGVSAKRSTKCSIVRAMRAFGELASAPEPES